jgi:dGTPase
MGCLAQFEEFSVAEKMDWLRLLSPKRLGMKKGKKPEPGRSEFQRDYDRIIFSSAFRRLQDKTQVFPLAQSDYVRTRLTHSLEASCVGRSLGSMVGAEILEKHPVLKQNGYTEADFGSIVATACLAHDIGNPPFGHGGESAIQDWFKFDERAKVFLDELDSEAKKEDFKRLEGNAQGFRILVRLQNDNENGGLQLTCATLAAFTKYPCGSSVSGQADSSPRWKKHGFFQDDRKWFEEVASETGLLCLCEGEVWARHPLAYLVEAADDICYRIVDAEDGYRTGYISYEDLTERFERIVDNTEKIKRAKAMSADRQIEYLRAVAINKVIQQVAKKFMEAEPDFLAGRFGDNLLGYTDAGKILKDLKQLAREKAYKAGPVVQIEAAGFNVLGELISRFAEASWNQWHWFRLIPDAWDGEDFCQG